MQLSKRVTGYRLPIDGAIVATDSEKRASFNSFQHSCSVAFAICCYVFDFFSAFVAVIIGYYRGDDLLYAGKVAQASCPMYGSKSWPAGNR